MTQPVSVTRSACEATSVARAKDSRRTDSCRPPRWSSSPRGWSDRASVAVGERAGRRLREPTRCSRDLRVPARQRSQPPWPGRSLRRERQVSRPGHQLRLEDGAVIQVTSFGWRDGMTTQVARFGERDGTRVQVASFGWKRRSLPSGRQLRLEETERQLGKRADKRTGFGQRDGLGAAASASSTASAGRHTKRLRSRGKPGDLGRRDARAAKGQGPTPRGGGPAARRPRGTGSDGSERSDARAGA